jgi:hypothetical protein
MMVGRKKLVLVQGYLRGKSKIRLTSQLVWDKHASFFCASVGDEDKKKVLWHRHLFVVDGLGCVRLERVELLFDDLEVGELGLVFRDQLEATL